jgi:uncharacterized protein (DUF952 family)
LFAQYEQECIAEEEAYVHFSTNDPSVHDPNTEDLEQQVDQILVEQNAIPIENKQEDQSHGEYKDDIVVEFMIDEINRLN